MSYESFKERLARFESGGYYEAVSDSGTFLGKYQFGPPRLFDLGLMVEDQSEPSGYTWRPGLSRRTFLSNAGNVQETAFRAHVASLCEQFDEDVIRFYADGRWQMVAGVTVRENHSLPGLVAVAHLLGFSRAVEWSLASPIERRENPAFEDGNGTKARKYYNALKSHYLFDLCQ